MNLRLGWAGLGWVGSWAGLGAGRNWVGRGGLGWAGLGWAEGWAGWAAPGWASGLGWGLGWVVGPDGAGLGGVAPEVKAGLVVGWAPLG